MVSIHAPTRGATIEAIPYLRTIQVSIHAPTRGATTVRPESALLDGFQSTHPHGVRPTKSNLTYWVWVVSIHAPTRGATFSNSLRSIHVLCFNPRTHTGCDRSRKRRGSSIWEFQSTHPHGVRRAHIHFSILSCKFQSTHPHGVRRPINNQV